MDTQRLTPEILQLIEEIWENNKDLRFFQLIYILQNQYSKENKDYGKIDQVPPDGLNQTGYDMFNLEDEKLLKYLQRYLKENA